MPGHADRYVRLYCDDSPAWRELGYAGRSLVMHLLRVVDTEGAVYIGTAKPWELAVDMFEASKDAAEPAMARALRLGVVEHRGHFLCLPGFRQEQKRVGTDALRKRESRRRQRDLDLHAELTKSQNVTPIAKSQSVTPTNGYHANLAENASLSQCPTGHVTRDIVTTMRDLPPLEDDPGQIPIPQLAPWVELIKVWEKVAFNGMPCGDKRSHQGRLLELWDACKARDPHDPIGVFRRAAEGFCETQRKRGKAPQLRWFAGDFETFADTYKPNGKRTSPLIQELEATKALHEQAVKAGDAEAAARLGQELRNIGQRMARHV